LIYDRPDVAASYDDHFRRRVDRAEDRALDRLLIEHCGPLYGRAVLDLGCGTGALLDRHQPGHYLGVDSSEAMVKAFLRKHGHRFRSGRYGLAVGDACGDPGGWRPAAGPLDLWRSWDVVVALFSFSYFHEPLAALQTAWWALRPGGTLFVQAYAGRYLRRRHCLDDPDTAVKVMTPLILGDFGRRAGFGDAIVEGFRYLPDWIANLVPVGMSRAGRWLPPQAAMTLLLTATKPTRLGQPSQNGSLAYDFGGVRL
jgi:SAM-dependent methyltransferase